MRLQIDRARKIILLKWLRQGFIDTLDLPEAYEGGNLFLELLKEIDRAEEQEKAAKTAVLSEKEGKGI